MQIKPLNDWAVVVPSEAAGRTAGGLYIPDAAKEKPAEGVVEAIGPGALEEESWKEKKEKKKKERKFIPTTVKPGERVLYERYAGTKFELGGVERVLVRERNILGIFTGNPSSASQPLLLSSKTATNETSLAKMAMTAITANAPARPIAVKSAATKSAGKKGTTKKKAARKKPAKKQGAAAKKAAKKTTGKKTAGKRSAKTAKKKR
jgi:chaperonin GroES